MPTLLESLASLLDSERYRRYGQSESRSFTPGKKLPTGAKFVSLVKKDPQPSKSGDGDGRWVTLKGGQHVQIDDSGKVVSGPAALKGEPLGSAGEPPKKSSVTNVRPNLTKSDQQTEKSDQQTGKSDQQTEKSDQQTSPPPGVRTTKSGHWVGGTTLQATDLSIDPTRFQYKISGIDPKTGVTKELKKVTKFNPLLAGQLLVWHDPKDGKTYVVNGHHRAELASRSPHWDEDDTGWGWHGEMNVQYIPAANEKEARAMGALANIAEGRGTATDAAKFMRDAGVNVNALQDRGISLSGRIAADAPALAGLHNAVFQSLTNGMTTEGRALAIARHLTDQDLQYKLYQEVQKKERSSNKDIPDSHVAEMAREMDLAGKTKASGRGGSLFGADDDFEESLIFQRAALKSALRREMTSEKTTFRAVSSGKRVKRITGAGENKLDVETNRQRAQAADEAIFAFDKLANTKGELSDAIQQHADELFRNPKKIKSIVGRLRDKAIEIIGREYGGLSAGEKDIGAGGMGSEQPAERYSRTARPKPGASSMNSLTAMLNSKVERYAKFDESEHPRDHGKFATKEGGKASPKINDDYDDGEAMYGTHEEQMSRIGKAQPHEIGAEPEHAGRRWYNDRGAMPGEPTHFLDVGPDDDMESASVVIGEVVSDDDDGKAFYGVATKDGESLGLFSTLKEAAEAGERWADNREKYSLTERLHREFVELYAKRGGIPAAGNLGLNWDESKHPRDHGKFSSKPGAGAAAESPPTAKVAPNQQTPNKPKAGPANAQQPSDKQPSAEPAFALQPSKNAPPKGKGFQSPKSTQQALWHGMNDLPGQKKLFEGMDLGGKGIAPAESGAGKTKAPPEANMPPEAHASDPKTPPPPGPYYSPDPNKAGPGGITEAARVGVPGMASPPPPKIPRLPNLLPEERAQESAFADMFESDPDGMAGKMVAMMADRNGEIVVGDGPNIFATDEAKMLFSGWVGDASKNEKGEMDIGPNTKQYRSKFNTALHQTANALAKRAFTHYLDNVVSKMPPEQRTVLVTAGGVAAGKGFALGQIPAAKQLAASAAATWDTAGEQNSTELPWVAEECAKRGIKMHAVYVHADPVGTWENPAGGVVSRAEKKGRMVDAKAFADSYTIGARNFHAFQQQHANNPNVGFTVISNIRGQPTTQVASVPPEALQADPAALYQRCLSTLQTMQVGEHVKQGGSRGAAIWPQK